MNELEEFVTSYLFTCQIQVLNDEFKKLLIDFCEAFELISENLKCLILITVTGC